MKYVIIHGLNSRDNEGAPQIFQFWQQVTLLEKMLDFNGSIKGDGGKLPVQGTADAHSMAWTIEEVRVAKGDMLSTLKYLGTYISQDDFGWDSKETSSVDGRDGAMLAGMFTATRTFSVTCKPDSTIHFQASIAIKGG